jgi:hypothetical protein
LKTGVATLQKTLVESTTALTLVRGGRDKAQKFNALSLAEKSHYLQGVTAKERMDLIIGDPEGELLVRSMDPQEFFWMIKDIGETDALELLQLASPEQCLFLLDIESWAKWSFSTDKAVEWLGYLLEGGDERIRDLLPQLDHELLLLLFNKELIVGGGVGDMTNDEERLADWDHTFDDMFMLTFKIPKHSEVVGRFLESIYRLDHGLYVALMEGVKNDIDAELEDFCFRFRSGRLADMGFPPLDEALSIYARLNPDTFAVLGEKELLPADTGARLPVPIGDDNTLLQRALALVDTAELRMELNYLINTALVADETAFSDTAAMRSVAQRVYGYLNIALEFICEGNVNKAAEVLAGEELKRLFRLGYSILLRIRARAEKQESDNHATNKLLNGLKSKRPRFYRGLDPDGIDGYREFRSMSDVAMVDEFLRRLETS